jgi:hypothetical protein
LLTEITHAKVLPAPNILQVGREVGAITPSHGKTAILA